MDILNNIKASEKNGGIDLSKLPPGTRVEAQTLNTLYKICVVGDGTFEVEGGKYFPSPTVTRIAGSTWGGSMLKMKWLGVDMHIEMANPNPTGGRIMTTTAVKSLKVIAPDGSWEYTLGT